jgi:hypothetical protein
MAATPAKVGGATWLCDDSIGENLEPGELLDYRRIVTDVEHR